MLKKYILEIKERIEAFFWFLFYSIIFILGIIWIISELVKYFEPFISKDSIFISICILSIGVIGVSLLIAKFYNCFFFKIVFNKKYKPYIHNWINYLDKLIYLSIFIIVFGSVSMMSEFETFDREQIGLVPIISKYFDREYSGDLESQMLIQKEKENFRIKITNQLVAPLLLISCSCFVHDYKMRNYYKKEKVEIKIQGELTKIYDKEEVKNPKVEIKGSEGKVSFQWYERIEDTVGNIIWDEMMEKPINAGVYGVKAVLEETVKYERAESKFKDFKIEKASSIIEVQDNPNKVYDGQSIEDPSNIIKIEGERSIIFEWYQKETDENGEERWNLLDKAPKDIGSYKLQAILEKDPNHLAKVEKEFAITEK